MSLQGSEVCLCVKHFQTMLADRSATHAVITATTVPPNNLWYDLICRSLSKLVQGSEVVRRRTVPREWKITETFGIVT